MIIFCRLKEKDVILQKMHTVESDYKSQVSKLESDLEDQRAKNNVSPHCTVMRIVHFLSGLIFNASRQDFFLLDGNISLVFFAQTWGIQNQRQVSKETYKELIPTIDIQSRLGFLCYLPEQHISD